MAIAPAKIAESFQKDLESNNGCSRNYSYRNNSEGFVEEIGGTGEQRPVQVNAGTDYGQPRKRRRYGKAFTPAEFWALVVKGHPHRCWLWQSTTHAHNGYGAFWYPPMRRTMCAHRIAWLLTHGSIPGRLHVLHKCDNPICVNPRHLWLGTQLDNMRDMAAKGRRSPDCHTRKGAKFSAEHRAALSDAAKRRHAKKQKPVAA